MLDRLKANILFRMLLKRPNIDNAYKMVGPEDSWYDTITTVHNSLAEIKKLPHENLQITSHDGLKLKALYYPGQSEMTVIWVHGYTSHAERESAFPGLFYHAMGYNVLIPYLRAHGASEGRYISLGALEHRDMLKWVEWVNERHPNGSIVIHGLSMGGGIVLDLTVKEMKNVKCMIADAPSMRIEDIFRNVAGGVFKKDAEKVYSHVISRFRKEFGVNAADFDRMETVKNCRYPLLVSAGSNENMDEILASIQEQNPMDTTVLILPGCSHGNGMYKQTELYQIAIKAFLNEHL